MEDHNIITQRLPLKDTLYQEYSSTTDDMFEINDYTLNSTFEIMENQIEKIFQ